MPTTTTKQRDTVCVFDLSFCNKYLNYFSYNKCVCVGIMKHIHMVSKRIQDATYYCQLGVYTALVYIPI